MSFVARLDGYISKSVGRLPESLNRPMRYASFLGEPLVVIAAALVASAAAYFYGRGDIVWGFLAALAAFSLSTALKLFLHRTRPDTLYVTTMRFKSYSFPSGHTFGTTLIYGLLLYLAWFQLPSPSHYLVVGTGVVVIACVGVSRVYLGAHFPTDVLGAWILSLFFWILITTRVFSHA